jgi:hypothetical protein
VLRTASTISTKAAPSQGEVSRTLYLMISFRI